MVTLALLDPLDLTIALQWWDFENKTEITIGRASRNDVVIKDPRISRHHVLLSRLHSSTGDREAWQLTNQGKNDVFLNGRTTFRDIVPDKGEIQLAPDGPRLYFFLADQQTAEKSFQELSGKYQPRITVQQDSRGNVFSHPLPTPEMLDSSDVQAMDVQPAHVQPVNVPSANVQPAHVPSANVQPAHVPSANVQPAHVQPVNVQAAHVQAAHVQPVNVQAAHVQAIEDKIHNINDHIERCQHLDHNPKHLFCGNCGHPVSILRSIRQYDLLKVISEGEETYTYLGWISPQYREPSVFLSHSLVVIKQLNPNAAKSLKDQELFMRQAVTLNQLNHPTIPHFLDFFVEAHQFSLVMEWIPGKNLNEHVREHGPLTPEKAISCGLQVCNVLEYLQQQNPPLVHRDIKPANLILRYQDGRIVLVDFGVVKPLGGLEQTRLALSGYRAPEQLHGQTFPQSDFFSLGATLLYLLTGRDPSRIHQYQTQSAKYYEDTVPGISLPFAEVLRCLLHPNPRDRYHGIKQVKEGLKFAQQSLKS